MSTQGHFTPSQSPELAPRKARNMTMPSKESSRRQTCWLVLPAYNEELTLPPLLDRVRESMRESDTTYRVVIVDDGSSDATSLVAQSYAEKMPIVLERHPQNMGLGATIRDGLLKAAELADPGDVIVSMDADNSHNPGSIPRMRDLIREGADVVIASRYQHGSRTRGVPRFRRLLSYGAGWLFRIVFPIEGVRDYTCGFRAYRAAALQQAIRHYGATMFDQPGFQCMVDILLKLRRLNFIFAEVPMVLRYDLKESTSKMKVGKTIFNTLLLMLKRRMGR